MSIKQQQRGLIPGIIILLLALIAAIGSQSFLGACVHEDGGFGNCHWSAQMLLGVGVLEVALAAMALIFKKERAGLYIAALLSALLGILAPGTLMPLCAMPTMRCRALMQPSMIILFALMAIAALCGWLMVRRNRGEGH